MSQLRMKDVLDRFAAQGWAHIPAGATMLPALLDALRLTCIHETQVVVRPGRALVTSADALDFHTDHHRAEVIAWTRRVQTSEGGSSVLNGPRRQRHRARCSPSAPAKPVRGLNEGHLLKRAPVFERDGPSVGSRQRDLRLDGPVSTTTVFSGKDDESLRNPHDHRMAQPGPCLENIAMQNPEPIELYLAHLMRSCSTLGPGRRVVLWVARCSRNCPGCIAEPIIGPEAGRPTDVRDLARQILAWPEANALTLTGGEPFEQADALAELCMLLRASRDFSVMAFSGFSRRELEAATDRGRRALVEQLDILVDGPFVASRMGDFLWRGSDNQQVHLLTDRHADLESALGGPSAGVDFEVADDGGFFWAGIPTPGLEEALRSGLEAKGIKLSNFRGRA